MKTIIILTIFILAVSCRTPMNLQDYRDIYEVELITRIHILEWDNYAQECYNDSTASQKHITNGTWCNMTLMGCTDCNYCTAPSHCDITIYNHRKPTYEGFIEYLKAKYTKP